MQPITPFVEINRNDWAQYSRENQLPFPEIEIERLHAINEPLTADEIRQVYIPLAALLHLYVTAQQHLHHNTKRFLKTPNGKVPFIIGIAGSVAAGKSTTARVLKRLLAEWNEHPKVELVTTDGFLLPNEILEQRDLMNRKGFPESYDTKKLINFLSDLKSGKKNVAAPVYSHLYYDVMTDQQQFMSEPDIVIVEGINVLQVRTRPEQKEPVLFVSDFFDFSIYVHAEEEDLLQWYVDRFELLRQTAFQNPNSYFNRFAHLSVPEAKTLAHQIWNEINRPNLELNILPTRYRASLILEKESHHQVRKILLRKI
jgi:type I pantothenate kinase